MQINCIGRIATADLLFFSIVILVLREMNETAVPVEISG